jgi:hypothetical protein
MYSKVFNRDLNLQYNNYVSFMKPIKSDLNPYCQHLGYFVLCLLRYLKLPDFDAVF